MLTMLDRQIERELNGGAAMTPNFRRQSVYETDALCR
jgi:hypothetical protein